ncbi:hypothetical protein [Clostridium manihotivorum]|nr:hypothetical protein [Clostridium manihotivorum]
MNTKSQELRSTLFELIQELHDNPKENIRIPTRISLEIENFPLIK